MRLAYNPSGVARLYDPTIFFGTSTASAPTQSIKVDRASLDEHVLYPTREAILSLLSRRNNWDGRGSEAPDLAAVQRAIAFVRTFYFHAQVTSNVIGYEWVRPHVSSSEDGEVVLEWWRGEHKLTIYISTDSADFLKVWGPDIATQMTDGPVIGNQFQGLWRWLNA